MNRAATNLLLTALIAPAMAGCTLDYSGIADVLPDASAS